jgi:hypothetical protein
VDFRGRTGRARSLCLALERRLGGRSEVVYIHTETPVMAEHKHDDHPQAPGLAAMGWFAIFLFVVLMALVLFLQFKFGAPTAP